MLIKVTEVQHWLRGEAPQRPCLVYARIVAFQYGLAGGPWLLSQKAREQSTAGMWDG